MIENPTYKDIEKHLGDLGVPVFTRKLIGVGAEKIIGIDLDATGSLAINGAKITEEILKDFPVKITSLPNSDTIRIELLNFYPKGS